MASLTDSGAAELGLSSFFRWIAGHMGLDAMNVVLISGSS